MSAASFCVFLRQYLSSKVINKFCGNSSSSIGRRSLTTSTPCFGKRNFRKFNLPNKRGFPEFREKQSELGIVDHRGVRLPGVYADNNKHVKDFEIIPEMIPELVVPNLEGFYLKPYVSYRAPDVVQSEFTAKDLFDTVYANKIIKDFQDGQLDADGNPLKPSEHELLTPEEAKARALKSGSDMFG